MGPRKRRKRLPKYPMVTRGGIKIAQYMKRHGLKITEFAAASKASRVSIRNVVTGKRWNHIPVSFAFAMVKATGGFCSVEDFLPETAVRLSEADLDADDDEPAATGTDG